MIRVLDVRQCRRDALGAFVTQTRDLDALDLHERLLVLWNAIVGDALPATTKCAQILQGIPAGLPRQPMSMPSESKQAEIRKALEGLDLV